jgi:hypothetical protein
MRIAEKLDWKGLTVLRIPSNDRTSNWAKWNFEIIWGSLTINTVMRFWSVLWYTKVPLPDPATVKHRATAMATQTTVESISLFQHRTKAMATQATAAMQHKVFSRSDPTAKYTYFSIYNAHLMYNAHPKLFRHSF